MPGGQPGYANPGATGPAALPSRMITLGHDPPAISHPATAHKTQTRDRYGGQGAAGAVNRAHRSGRDGAVRQGYATAGCDRTIRRVIVVGDQERKRARQQVPVAGCAGRTGPRLGGHSRLATGAGKVT